MPSRSTAHSADSATPREGTLCSLPNQRSAAATLDLWLATVLAVTSRRAWCNWLKGTPIQVQRAGIKFNGRSNHMPTLVREPNQISVVALVDTDDCSINAMV